MVVKWIAIAIIVGLLGAMIPVILVWLWTISKLFVAALLLVALIVGFIYLVLDVSNKEIKIKKLEEELEQKENE